MAAKPKKLTYNPLDLIVSNGEPEVEGPITELDPALIAANPHQPRQFHDPAEQAEIEASIRVAGIHQPLLVRRMADGSHQLVAGSRRLEAALAVGLSLVPVVVREYSDEQAEQVALIENLQRSNLRFDDEAFALLRLKRQGKLSNEALGRVIGKSTDYVELRIAAAEHPLVLEKYMAGEIDQKQIRTTIRQLTAPGDATAGERDSSDPNRSDQPDEEASASAGQHTSDGAGGRPGRRPPDGWRWAGDAERRLQQLPERASRMDNTERARAREYLLRLREAADRALDRLSH